MRSFPLLAVFPAVLVACPQRSSEELATEDIQADVVGSHLPDRRAEVRVRLGHEGESVVLTEGDGLSLVLGGAETPLTLGDDGTYGAPCPGASTAARAARWSQNRSRALPAGKSRRWRPLFPGRRHSGLARARRHLLGNP